MKEVLEGKLSPDAAQPHIDRCLGCLACEPACPSGVPYRDLISPYRATVGAATPPPGAAARLRRWLAGTLLPRPAAFRAAARAGLLARRILPWTPPALRPLLRLLP
jgi:glycolate oxidase iron-sulfur subunit